MMASWFPVVYLVAVSLFAEVANALEDVDALAYLETYGYLDDVKDYQHDPKDISKALRELQTFNGLPVTGQIDKQTVDFMKRPRCAHADVIKPRKRATNGTIPLNYNAPGVKWNKDVVTWKIVNYSPQLSRQSQREAWKKALKAWSDVSKLRFREVRRGPADMEFLFATGDHGDNNKFTSNGNVLAHAFQPGGPGISGDVHVNEAKRWSLFREPREGETDLLQPITHEIGHALGLKHSGIYESMMTPAYRGYDPENKLHQDDITAIQILYGSPRGWPQPTCPPAPRRPRCSLAFGAASFAPTWEYLGYKRDKVYSLEKSGPTNERRISDVFRGAPSSPDAVAMNTTAWITYIFKGQKVWAFKGQDLQPGYPKWLPRDFANIEAALRNTGDQTIYVFQGDKVSTWTPTMRSYPAGYPKKTSEVFAGARNIKMAYESRGPYINLYGDQRVWVYDSAFRPVPCYPRYIEPKLLSC